MLLRHALPRLYLAVLKDLARPDGMAAAVFARLPDLERVAEAWKPCAVSLYSLLREEPILPHLAGGQNVSPGAAAVLGPRMMIAPGSPIRWYASTATSTAFPQLGRLLDQLHLVQPSKVALHLQLLAWICLQLYYCH